MVAGARTLAYVLVFLLLAVNVPAQAQSVPLPGLGMDQGSVAGLQQAGAPPVYGSYWVGVWMAVHGWAGLDNALKSAKATGVTPVVYWYYWGDEISPSCVENGCEDKSMAQWVAMTQTLADKVRTHMAGAPVIIVLENEFNKGGVTDDWYAPTFDSHLEARAATLKAVPGVSVSLGFGSWGESSWHKFPKAMAASDSIGFQLMRASTKDSEASYRGSADKIADTLRFIRQISGKPGFLYDLALSSYPEPAYRAVQAETLKSILDRRAEYAQTGLIGIVYRELRDNPSMGTHNYFGIAEQYWGFKDTSGGNKPAWDVWMAANNGAAPPPPPPPAANAPGSFEGEAMTASTGGRAAEASGSGGASWNLWTNGDLRQQLLSEQGGAHRVTVVARGTQAAGIDARMELRLDGALLGAFDVSAGALREYAVDAFLPAGGSLLSVRFTNDALTATEDRNLFVDVVHVAAPAPNRAPLPRFTAAATDLSLDVDASGSTDPDGDALAYAWDFGDGATATGVRATHAYAQPGDYVVTLAVSDGQARSVSTTSVAAHAPNRAPAAAFDVAGGDLDWRFDAAPSTDPDGDALTYAWSFGDGTSATGAQVSKTYATAGDRVVTLTVADGKAEASATRVVQARAPNRAPTAAMAASGSELSWSFDASGSADPDGDALAYAWTFPDGATASGVRFAKTFATAGDHLVRLRVSDPHGASDETTLVVAARAPAPASRLAQGEAFQAKDNGVAFSDASASEGHAWLLWANGGMRQAFAPGAGTHRVDVVAKGDYASGWPLMELRADGVVVGRWTVSTSAWATYSASVAFKAGEARVLSVHFTNDAVVGGADRNLRVDLVRVAPPSLAVEAEAFQAKDNGAAFRDGAASAGSAWLLWSNGAMSHRVAPGAGAWSVEVVAKGDHAAGWPLMELRADGAPVARWTVGSSTWQPYRADLDFGQGAAKTLSVHFLNDHRGAEGDRNLRVDLVRLAPR